MRGTYRVGEQTLFAETKPHPWRQGGQDPVRNRFIIQDVLQAFTLAARHLMHCDHLYSIQPPSASANNERDLLDANLCKLITHSFVMANHDSPVTARRELNQRQCSHRHLMQVFKYLRNTRNSKSN